MRISMETHKFEFELTGNGLFVRAMGREFNWEFGARPILSRLRAAKLQDRCSVLNLERPSFFNRETFREMRSPNKFRLSPFYYYISV